MATQTLTRELILERARRRYAEAVGHADAIRKRHGGQLTGEAAAGMAELAAVMRDIERLAGMRLPAGSGRVIVSDNLRPACRVNHASPGPADRTVRPHDHLTKAQPGAAAVLVAATRPGPHPPAQ